MQISFVTVAFPLFFIFECHSHPSRISLFKTSFHTMFPPEDYIINCRKQPRCFIFIISFLIIFTYFSTKSTKKYIKIYNCIFSFFYFYLPFQIKKKVSKSIIQYLWRLSSLSLFFLFFFCIYNTHFDFQNSLIFDFLNFINHIFNFQYRLFLFSRNSSQTLY